MYVSKEIVTFDIRGIMLVTRHVVIHMGLVGWRITDMNMKSSIIHIYNHETERQIFQLLGLLASKKIRDGLSTLLTSRMTNYRPKSEIYICEK